MLWSSYNTVVAAIIISPGREETNVSLSALLVINVMAFEPSLCHMEQGEVTCKC